MVECLRNDLLIVLCFLRSLPLVNCSSTVTLIEFRDGISAMWFWWTDSTLLGSDMLAGIGGMPRLATVYLLYG